MVEQILTTQGNPRVAVRDLVLSRLRGAESDVEQEVVLVGEQCSQD